MTKPTPPGFDPTEFTAAEIETLRVTRYVHFADRDGCDAPFGPSASREPYFISASQPDVIAVAKHNREYGTRYAYWDRSNAYGPSDFKLGGRVLFREGGASVSPIGDENGLNWVEFGGGTIIGYERYEPAVCSAPPGEPSDEDRAFRLALSDIGANGRALCPGSPVVLAAQIVAGYIMKHEPDRLLSPEALAEKAKAAAYSRFAGLRECYIPNDDDAARTAHAQGWDDTARTAHGQGWDDATAFLKGQAND